MAKIIIHSPFFPMKSGIADYVEELYGELQKDKENHFVKANPEFWAKHKKTLEGKDISNRKLRGLLKEYKLYDEPGNIHHFHMNCNAFNLLFLEAFKKIKGKKIITIHDNHLFTQYTLKENWEKNWNVMEDVFKQADKIIVHSTIMGENIIGGVPFEVIRHGVDYEKYAQKVKKISNFKGVVVSSLGFLHEYKNSQDFVRAVKGIDAVKIIVGDGPEKRKLMKYSKIFNAGIDFFKADSEELFDRYIKSSDIVVFNRKDYSKFETSGVLVKAMAAGCCIVSYDVGAFEEYLAEDRGFLVSPHHFAFLGEALRFLIKNPKLREKIAKTGQAFAKKELDYRIFVKKHLKLYSDVFKKKSLDNVLGEEKVNYSSEFKRKIAILSPYAVWPNLSGGRERTYYFAKYLQSFGNEVLLTQAKDKFSPPNINVVNINSWKSEEHGEFKAMASRRGFIEVVRALKKFKPDIIILDYMYPCAMYLGELRKKFPKVSVFLNAHNVEWKYHRVLGDQPKKYTWKQIYSIEKKVLEQVDGIFYVSEEEKKEFQKMLGDKKKKFIFAPNGTLMGGVLGDKTKITRPRKSGKLKESIDKKEVEKELKIKNSKIIELKKEIDFKEGEVWGLHQNLRRVERSLLWSSLMTFHKFVDMIMPLGTSRRRLYDFLIHTNQSIAHEGFKSIFDFKSEEKPIQGGRVFDVSKLKGDVCIYLSSKDHWPNEVGSAYILEHLSKKMPEVMFLITGTSNVCGPGEYGNVTFTGYINNLDEVLSACDIAINPILAGAGTNLKMLSYLAKGLPVVTTKIGARGLEGLGNMFICDVFNFHKCIRKVLRMVWGEKIKPKKLPEDYLWGNIVKKIDLGISKSKKIS